MIQGHLKQFMGIQIKQGISRSPLSVPPFYLQDFGSSLLPLLWILFQVECLFPLHLSGLVGFYYVPSSAWMFLCLFILSDLLCLGSPFCRLPLHGWVWTSALRRFPGWVYLCLFSGGWSWILSLWRVVPCPVVCFGDVYGLNMAVDSLSANGQVCVTKVNHLKKEILWDSIIFKGVKCFISIQNMQFQFYIP